MRHDLSIAQFQFQATDVEFALVIFIGLFFCSNRLGENSEGSVDHIKPLIVNHHKFVQPS